MSFNGGYHSNLNHGNTKAGAVFIIDIQPQMTSENVGGKVFSSNGKVLEHCISSTDLVQVFVLAITGFSSFEPTVLVQEQPVQLIQNEDQNIWTGTINLDLNQQTIIKAIHNDGATHEVTVLKETKPIITLVEFTGGYPNGQTEVKHGDIFSIQVQSDTLFKNIEIDDFGASYAQHFNLQPTQNTTVPITIANRGIVAQKHGIRVRVQNENNTFSDWYNTQLFGDTNGQQQIILNNLKPAITLSSISYPLDQLALKNNETATIEHTLDHYDTIQYTSPNQELQILDADDFENIKTVQRIAGNYNTQIPNLLISATRKANGAQTQLPVVVSIANIPAILTFISPNNRLISGGNRNTLAQKHVLSISSDQKLLSPPEINAPIGILISGMQFKHQSENTFLYTQLLSVHDNDPKGVFDLQLLNAKNLAGIPTQSFNTPANYEIGGFTKRTITIPSFQNTIPIGTKVGQINKLKVFDKDLISMTYVDHLNDQLLSYSIVQITSGHLTVTPNGDTIYWNDQQAVNNNTTGLATITIEEPP